MDYSVVLEHYRLTGRTQSKKRQHSQARTPTPTPTHTLQSNEFFYPFRHPTHSSFSHLQNCTKNSPLQTIPQGISKSVFLVAFPIFTIPHPLFHSFCVCVCVCVRACMCVHAKNTILYNLFFLSFHCIHYCSFCKAWCAYPCQWDTAL